MSVGFPVTPHVGVDDFTFTIAENNRRLDDRLSVSVMRWRVNDRRLTDDNRGPRFNHDGPRRLDHDRWRLLHDHLRRLLHDDLRLGCYYDLWRGLDDYARARMDNHFARRLDHDFPPRLNNDFRRCLHHNRRRTVHHYRGRGFDNHLRPPLDDNYLRRTLKNDPGRRRRHVHHSDATAFDDATRGHQPKGDCGTKPNPPIRFHRISVRAYKRNQNWTLCLV